MEKTNRKDFIKILFIGIYIVVITFPENDWSFFVGIDSPLSWVFNFIYENNLVLGKSIIFPHGPLAFFMYPLPNNILLVTFILTLLKILVVLNLYVLFKRNEGYKWFFTFVIAYIIGIIADLNHLIIANVILLFCNYYNTEKHFYKITAFFLTAFAFFIKSYVAIVSGIICFSFVVYYFMFKHKSYKIVVYDVLFILGMLVLFWFFMYGTFSGFIEYGIGMFQLAQDNSSAAAYYPYNNWWALTVFLIIAFFIPFINKSKTALFYGALTTLSLFAAWKHGMAREDSYHVRGFLTYVIISFFIFIPFYKNNYKRNLSFAIIAIFLLFVNMKNCINYIQPHYELNRINNFIDFSTNLSALKDKSTTTTKTNIAPNKLPSGVRESINKSTVDIYPWDYSIVAANDLNWKPRVVIQSYASYTHWLDNKNAEHFNSEMAPEYIIWDLDKFTTDMNGGAFNSIDNRYLLNDEPLTIIQILKNYKRFYSDDKFLVLKKRINTVKSKKSTTDIGILKWGEWIDVPTYADGLLRAKIKFRESISQKLKSFLYKDEQFWVYLKLENNMIHKYRIVPKNAVDGIWINPYILDSISHYEVKQISFKCSNQHILSKDITINWEKFEFENDPEYVLNFFNIKDVKDSILVNSINNFEKNTQPHWQNVTTHNFSLHSYSGINSYVLKPNAYSLTFAFQMDSLPNSKLKISTDCWMNSLNYKYKNNILLIISIDDKNGNITWKGLSIDEQLLGNKEWYTISNYINYDNDKPNATLKIYVWNNSNQELLMDDFRIRINNIP